MFDAVILSLSASLKKLPTTAIPSPDNVSTAAPTAVNQLPAITLGLAESRHRVSGIGGVVLDQKIDPTQWEQRFARRVEGTLRIDVYAGDDAETFSLAGAALEQIDDDMLELRAAGYLHLGAVVWDRVEVVTLGTGTSGPRAVRQTLAMEFAFENVEQQLPGPGGEIQQVDVEMPSPIEENFQVN